MEHLGDSCANLSVGGHISGVPWEKYRVRKFSPGLGKV